MKRVRSNRFISLCIIIMTLLCGICLSASQADSLFVYPTHTSQVSVSMNWESDSISQAQNSFVYTYSECYTGEIMYIDQGSRHGHGHHWGNQMEGHILPDLFSVWEKLHYKVILQNEFSYRFCRTIIIDYLHQTDGLKG